MRVLKYVLGVSCLVAATSAMADNHIIDRGLPTNNLNNAAGDNRSNVTWALNAPFFIGDSFTLKGDASTLYNISEIQTWVVSRDGTPLSASLYTGSGANADLTMTSATPTFTQVHYADGSDYQTISNAFRSIYQVDFSGLNISALGGTTISFGVDGVNPGGYPFFNHASNGALSGSAQDGSDDTMSYYYHDGAGATYYAPYMSKGNGWDKQSDIDVRVYGTSAAVSAVPEPATWAMMIIGMGGIGVTMRRRETKRLKAAVAA